MKISVGTQDIYDYLDVEYYIKDRDYFINYQECEFLKKKCEEIGVLDTVFKQDECYNSPPSMTEGQIVFRFIDCDRNDFYCWSNVKKFTNEEIRSRIITLNHEDLHTKEDINKYLEERKRLVNQKEYLLLNKICKILKANRMKYEHCNYIGNVKNQTAGVWRGYFGDYELWTNVMHYKFNTDVLERRREECELVLAKEPKT